MTGRLIDVGATIETLSKDPLFPLVEKYGLSTVLEAMPTVEAIPIEFIKQCQSNHLTFTELLDAWAERKDE